MKNCKVIIPFKDKVTGELHRVNSEIALSEERIAEIKSVNVNMIQVLSEAHIPTASTSEDVENATKPRATKPRATKPTNE